MTELLSNPDGNQDPGASWKLGLGACEQPHGGVPKVEEHFEFESFL